MKILDKLLKPSRLALSKVSKTKTHRYSWLNILDDDIHDCEQAIQKAKQQLAIITSERLQLEIDICKIKDTITTLEELTLNALSTEDNENAMESALQIAFYEAQIQETEHRHARITSEEQYISRNLHEDSQIVKLLRQEFKQPHNRQALSAGKSSAKTKEIRETLSRIKSTQLWNASHIETRQQLKSNIDNEQLNTRVLNNTHTLGDALAYAVLERIQQKHFAHL